MSSIGKAYAPRTRVAPGQPVGVGRKTRRRIPIGGSAGIRDEAPVAGADVEVAEREDGAAGDGAADVGEPQRRAGRVAALGGGVGAYESILGRGEHDSMTILSPGQFTRSWVRIVSVVMVWPHCAAADAGIPVSKAATASSAMTAAMSPCAQLDTMLDPGWRAPRKRRARTLGLPGHGSR